MKKLVEAKIEQFGYQVNYLPNFDVLGTATKIMPGYNIIYVYEHSFLFFKRRVEHKLPISFSTEYEAKDFIECGGRCKEYKTYGNRPMFYIYRESEPDYIIHPIEYRYKQENGETVVITNGFYSKNIGQQYNEIFSGFLRKLEEYRNKEYQKELKKQKEKQESENIIKNMHEVKVYKIQNI